MKKIIASYVSLVLIAPLVHAKPPENLPRAACEALIPYIRGYDQPVPCGEALTQGVTVGSPNYAEYRNYVGLCYVGNRDAVEHPRDYVIELSEDELRKMDPARRREVVRTVTLHYSASQKDYVPVASLSDEDNAILDHVHCLRLSADELAKGKLPGANPKVAKCANLPPENWMILRSLPVPLHGQLGQEPTRSVTGIPYLLGNRAENIALFRSGVIPANERVPPLVPPAFLGLSEKSEAYKKLEAQLKSLESSAEQAKSTRHAKLMDLSREANDQVNAYLRNQKGNPKKAKRDALKAVEKLSGAQQAYRKDVLTQQRTQYWEHLVNAVMKDGGCLDSHFGPNHFCKGLKGIQLESCLQQLRDAPSLAGMTRALAHDPQYVYTPGSSDTPAHTDEPGRKRIPGSQSDSPATGTETERSGSLYEKTGIHYEKK